MNKKNAFSLVCATSLILCTSLVYADPVIQVVWSCTLNEGKTLEDAHAANAAWVKWSRDNGGKSITSEIANRVMGGDLSTVLLIDSYPDWDTYAEEAGKYDSAAGEAMDAAFEDALTCTSNAVWSVEGSGAE